MTRAEFRRVRVGDVLRLNPVEAQHTFPAGLFPLGRNNEPVAWLFTVEHIDTESHEFILVGVPNRPGDGFDRMYGGYAYSRFSRCCRSVRLP